MGRLINAQDLRQRAAEDQARAKFVYDAYVERLKRSAAIIDAESTVVEPSALPAPHD